MRAMLSSLQCSADQEHLENIINNDISILAILKPVPQSVSLSDLCCKFRILWSLFCEFSYLQVCASHREYISALISGI